LIFYSKIQLQGRKKMSIQRGLMVQFFNTLYSRVVGGLLVRLGKIKCGVLGSVSGQEKHLF